MEQVKLADHHYMLNTLDEVVAFESSLGEGICLISGAAADGERVKGITPEVLDYLQGLAGKYDLPLLIEADGSRRKPLKAPAEHEPAIPPFVDTVVVMAGLTALGKPLSSDWVHRHDIFAALSGLRPGDEITGEGLGRVLTHPRGGLKNIPQGARRLLLLNQADTAELQSQAMTIARACLTSYEAIVVASLNLTAKEQILANQTQLEDESLDATLKSRIWAVHEHIAGVILAAGASSRLGQPKPLLSWRGEPLIRHVARVALGSGLCPVVVVGGEHVRQIREALSDLDVRVVYNADWERGQSTSLQAGLRALPTGIGGVVFLLADQPLITESVLRKLIETHALSLAPIVAPVVDGKRANPVLFDRVTFNDLMKLQGDVGGRALFGHYPVQWVPWFDSNLMLDIDTPEDYQKLLELD